MRRRGEEWSWKSGEEEDKRSCCGRWEMWMVLGLVLAGGQVGEKDVKPCTIQEAANEERKVRLEGVCKKRGASG